MSKIKNILFRAKLKGEGVVNADSNDQKHILKGLEINHLLPMDDNGFIMMKPKNVKYSKKVFYSEDGENPYYKIMISSDAMRKAIFGQEMPFTSSMVANDEKLLINFIAHPATFLRGHMLTTGKNNNSFNRKSPVYTSNAIQSNDCVSYLEVKSSSGYNDSNSLFYEESVGEIEYNFSGNINLQEIQFMPLSEIFGRQAFNPDLFELYCERMKLYFDNFDAKLGHYLLKNCALEITERGFTVSDETIVDLVKYFFNKLLTAKLTKSKSFADVVEVQYKLVGNPLKDLRDDETNWITLNEDNVNDISFNTERFYVECENPLLIKREVETINTYKKNVEIKRNKKKEDADKKAEYLKNKDNE